MKFIILTVCGVIAAGLAIFTVAELYYADQLPLMKKPVPTAPEEQQPMAMVK